MEIPKLLILSERWLHDVTPLLLGSQRLIGPAEKAPATFSLSALVDVVPGEEELTKVARCTNTGWPMGAKTLKQPAPVFQPLHSCTWSLSDDYQCSF